MDNAPVDARVPSKCPSHKEFLKCTYNENYDHHILFAHQLTSRTEELNTEFVEIRAKQSHFMFRLDQLYHVSVHSKIYEMNKKRDDEVG